MDAMTETTNTSSALRLTRLHLSNWRNFTEVNIKLAPRVFFVGPNASGKSNLLKAFRFLHDLVDVGGGLQAAIRREGGEDGIKQLRCFAAGRNPKITIDVSLGTDEKPILWRYKLTFNDNKKMMDGTPVVYEETVWHEDSPVLQRPNAGDKTDREGLQETAVEHISANKAFRPVAIFFKSIRYSNVVPQVVRHPARYESRDDPYGSDLLEKINAAPETERKKRLALLNEALTVAVPQLKSLKLDHDNKGLPHLKANYTHWRRRGVWQNEEHFSDGTIRLLGFLWELQEEGGPLLLEEPELSLHPEVARQIPGMITRAQRRSGRQAIITTHSKDVLDSAGIGLDEVHLLRPSPNGTKVITGTEIANVKAMVNAGTPVGEAIIPQAQPKNAGRLLTMDI